MISKLYALITATLCSGLLLLPNFGYCQTTRRPPTAKELRIINKLLLEGATEAPELKAFALAIPNKLEALGLGNISLTSAQGRISLLDLKEKIEKTTFKENSSFVGTEAPGTYRSSAYYDPKTRSLVLNSTIAPVIYAVGLSLEQAKEQHETIAEPLLLHEALGANRVDDRKYDKSLGLYFLSSQSGKEGRLQKPAMAKALAGALARAGGATIVGGGGDYSGLVLKRLIINMALFSEDSKDFSVCQHREAGQLFVALLDLAVELDPNRGVYRGSQNFDFQLNYLQEKNLVLFDHSAWAYGANSPRAATAIRDFLKVFCGQ